MKSCFVYEPCLSDYELSQDHPFKPVRLELTRTLLESLSLLSEEHMVGLEGIGISRNIESEVLEMLYTMHTPEYVEAVRYASSIPQTTQDSQPQTPSDKAASNLSHFFGLATNDTPIFPNMHSSIANVCLATIKAMDIVASGKVTRAVNFSGGLHHAHAKKASGFCVYNDLALGIDYVRKHYGTRVMYIDIDAHHGDGVQSLFYEDGNVMTYSIHESGRYLFPGTGHTYELGKATGRGMSVNMPLEPFSEDATYLANLKKTLPPALAAFKPDMILLQVGADMHKRDPLADLALSVQGMANSYSYICDLADEYCKGKIVATGGGGYDPFHVVPRAWACLWATMTRQPIPKVIPEAWQKLWAAQSPHPLPKEIFDDLETWQEIPRRAEINKHNAAVAKRLLNTLEPVWKDL